MIDTKQKILDTAERLFSENGYDATSLRQIIAEAEVNLASIHYHFGSKEELLDELVVRKAGPVNDRRLAELARIETEAGEGPVEIEELLRAFLKPMADSAGEHPEFVRLMGRLHAEGILPSVMRRNFHPVLSRFMPALRRSLPELSEREFGWRIHFMMGAMAHTMCGVPLFLHGWQPNPAEASATGEGADGDFGERIERLLVFLSAGLRAAPSVESGTEAAAQERIEVTK